jgi:NADH-quinone oxidoreductase subunit N
MKVATNVTQNPNLIHDLRAVSPLLLLSAGAFILLLIDVARPARWPRVSFTAVTLIAALIGAVLFQEDFGLDGTAFSGILFADPFSWFFTVLLIAGTLLCLPLMASRLEENGVESPGEFYSLLLMSTAGAVVFVSSADLVTLFLGLEIMSMALYALCGSALGRRASSESALKYFLLGSFSSAFLLYGFSLLYGLTGVMDLPRIAAAIGSADRIVSACAIGLILVGLLFKLGAVPFHFWAPDVYQGAPTPVTAYMACVVKAAAVAVTLRVLWVGFGSMAPVWTGAVWVVALLTMIVGNLIAVRQRNVKRLLAYSSIAHAGYLSMALLAPSNQFGGGSAVLFYLVAYTLMTLGSFAVLAVVSGGNPDGEDISHFHGLAKTNPGLAAAMAVFMLSLAGIPPGMAGLLGKFYLFSAVVNEGFVGLAVVGVLCSAVSCFYDLRLIVAMYFTPQDGEGVGVANPGFPLTVSLSVCVVGVVLVGVFPSALYGRAAIIMNSILQNSL